MAAIPSTPIRDTDPLQKLTRSLPLALAITAVVAVAGVGVWWLSQGSGTASTVAAPTTVEQPTAAETTRAASELSIESSFELASAAVAAQRIVAPVGDNAFEHYLAVLTIEPENVAARRALLELFPMGLETAESALARGDLETASRIAGLLNRADGDSYTLRNLVATIETQRNTLARAELEAANAAEAKARAVEAAQAQRASLASAPAANTPPANLQASVQAPASTMAATPPVTRAQPAPASTVAPPPAAPVVAAAAPPSPPPAKPVAQGNVREAALIKQYPPQYPPQALKRKLEGSVDLEIIVSADGTVRTANVLRGQPAGVFDREALRAVQRWKFSPKTVDSKPVEAKVRRTLQFKLNT